MSTDEHDATSSQFQPDMGAITGNDPDQRRAALDKMVDYLQPILDRDARRFYNIGIALEGRTQDKEFFPDDLMPPREICSLVNEAFVHIIEQMKEGKYVPERHPIFAAWAIKTAENYWISLTRKSSTRHQNAINDISIEDMEEHHNLATDDEYNEDDGEAQEILADIRQEIEKPANRNHLLKRYIEACEHIAQHDLKPKPQAMADLLNVAVKEIYQIRKYVRNRWYNHRRKRR